LQINQVSNELLKLREIARYETSYFIKFFLVYVLSKDE